MIVSGRDSHGRYSMSDFIPAQLGTWILTLVANPAGCRYAQCCFLCMELCGAWLGIDL